MVRKRLQFGGTGPFTVALVPILRGDAVAALPFRSIGRPLCRLDSFFLHQRSSVAITQGQ